METPSPAEIESAAHTTPTRLADGRPPAFTPLDPRVVSLWRLDNAVGYGILLLLSGAGAFFLGRAIGPVAWPWLAVAWGALALWSAFMTMRHPTLAYAASGYLLEERVLLIRRGVWWQTIQFLPLSRLQHVDLNRGPFERRYGLASLVLHTAGTHAASLQIPGLDADEAVRLRDQLVATGAGGDDAV
ncbi:MAG TPA: PH domain-containing protein [Armatimonadaceae bacterium]|jgi:membrane protein YdbS with pleckstrin-like domain|nr:PH domain-containing protein [Armatimonadaceae bacterium]